MAKRDPIQEEIERVRQGADPRRPVSPIGTQARGMFPGALMGGAAGAFGGGGAIPPERKHALQWLMDALRRK